MKLSNPTWWMSKQLADEGKSVTIHHMSCFEVGVWSCSREHCATLPNVVLHMRRLNIMLTFLQNYFFFNC